MGTKCHLKFCSLGTKLCSVYAKEPYFLTYIVNNSGGFKLKVRCEGNKCSSALSVDLKMFLNHNPNPMKANLCPQFNLNSTPAQFNSNSTKFQLNFISTLTSISTSTCPRFNLRLKSNSASISTST